MLKAAEVKREKTRIPKIELLSVLHRFFPLVATTKEQKAEERR